ncbi:MAG: transporter substrate-binding domain-containing protein [Gammaproteobacteria bacterium]|nr:transporter substrate-binding domain-containing protein [Gammaproteobacteria bacterium]
MQRLICLSLFAFTLLSLAPPLYAEKTLVFSTFPSSGLGQIFTTVLTEAYQPLAIPIELSEQPADRALKMADAGIVDGEAGRLSVVENITRNLIRVPVPIFHMRAFAYSKSGQLPINGYDSLAPYRIAVLRGYKQALKMTQGMQREIVDDYQQLRGLLENGRVDVVILTEVDALNTFGELLGTTIHPIQPPINQGEMYHYLHQSHQALLPRITASLQKMEQSGRIREIAQAYYRSFQR